MIYIGVLLRVYYQVSACIKDPPQWTSCVASVSAKIHTVTPTLLIISNLHLCQPNYILVGLQVLWLNKSLPLENPLDG